MNNFVPGPRPPLTVYGPEIEEFRHAVYVAVCEVGAVYSIPESGDRPSHAAEIADRLLSLAPTAFSSFIMAHAAADPHGAMNAIREGLAALAEGDANLFAISGCNAKQLYRYVSRRFLADQQSADAQADYAGPPEARKAAYEICAVKGWSAADFVDEAMALNNRILRDRADKEAADHAARLERIRKKTQDNSDPTAARRSRVAFGTYGKR